MDKNEWSGLSALVDNWWSQPEFTDDRAASYYELLCGYDLGQVEVAFRELLSEGHQFLPSLSVVLAKLEDNANPALRFEAMWRALRAALYEESPERFLETEHPLYLRFHIEQGGVSVLGRVDEANSYQMHSLRKAWKELSAEYQVEARRGRVRTMLTARPLVPPNAAQGQNGPRKISSALARALPQGPGGES